MALSNESASSLICAAQDGLRALSGVYSACCQPDHCAPVNGDALSVSEDARASAGRDCPKFSTFPQRGKIGA